MSSRTVSRRRWRISSCARRSGCHGRITARSDSGDEGNRLAADPRARVFVVLDQYHVSFDGSHATPAARGHAAAGHVADRSVWRVYAEDAPAGSDAGAKALTLEDELARSGRGERFAHARG